VERVYCASPCFSAGVLEAESGERVKFRGKFQAAEGEPVSIEGAWVEDPKFGRQFAVDRVVYDLPESKDGLIRYLAGHSAFKGIGEATARKIVEYAGTAANLDRLVRDGIQELRAHLRLSMTTLHTLQSAWIKHAAENAVRAYLSAFDLTPHQIDTLLDRFGDGVIGVLKADPYQLIRHVPGYGFKRVDEIARKMRIPKNHPGRIRAGVLHVVHEEVDSGHTWVDAGDLIRRANDLLVLDDLDSLDLIRAAGKTLVDAGDLGADGQAVTLPALLQAERFVFDTFVAIARQPGHAIRFDPALATGLLSGQKIALETAVSSRVAVITGAAGTGKTVTISRVAKAFTASGLKVIIAAPTGKASMRAEELLRGHGLDLEARTIHRLLGYDGRIFHVERLDADVLILDEVSMTPVDLMAEVLKRIDFALTTLILVGDHNQLPPVGPGSVLRDILAHGLVPCHVLTEVVRQAGALKQNSTALLDGRVEPTDSSARQWIVIDRFREPLQIQAYLRDLVMEQIPRFLGYGPLDIQILSPGHRGPLGTREINRMMQYLRHGQVTGRFAVGDRVVQKANDYSLGIFNGSLGAITGIEQDGIHVRFDLEGDRFLKRSKADALHLAYCLTIHSYQGSEARCVVMLLHKSHWHACRQLVYTGATRAQETLFLLGDSWGIRHAVRNRRAAERRTFMDLWATRSKACPARASA